MMPKNVQRYEWRTNEGVPVRVAIPFDCKCGRAATYGKDDVWYCTRCWLRALKDTHEQ